MAKKSSNYNNYQWYKTMDKTDLYSILGVPRHAVPPEIKLAYKKQANKHHPDKVKPEDRAEATERFQLIQQAYEVLMDEDMRRIYDAGGNPLQRLATEADQIIESAAIKLATDLFDSISEQCDERMSRKIDIAAVMRQNVDRIINETKGNKRKVLKAVRKQRQIRRRVKSNRLIKDHLHKKRVGLIEQWQVHKMQIRIARRVLGLIEDMEYEVDPEPPAPTQNGFFGVDWAPGSDITMYRTL